MRALPWLAVLGAYVAVALIFTPGDAPPQVPFLLERLRDEAGADVTAIVLAVPAALSFALAAALARHWVPDPWATRGVLVAAVSPLAFALPTHTRPDAIAAALLIGGLLLALRARDEATRARSLGGAACLALAPWFGLVYALAAVPALVALVMWTSRRKRPMLAFLAVEVGAASAVALVGVEQPDRRPGGDPLSVLGDVLAGAPILALAFLGAALLVRSRMERVSRAIPARRDAEVAAALTGIMVLGLYLAAAFGPVGPGAGVPLAAALGAWGLQRAPRIGAVLALATVVLAVLSVG